MCDFIKYSGSKNYIQFFCTVCENTMKVNWRKDSSCDNRQCNSTKLKYQCVACDKLYGSYQGAFSHVKSQVCNDFSKVPMIKLETNKVPEVTKKVNPYNKKFKKSKISVNRKSKQVCFKCKKTFKNLSGLKTHTLYCGVKKAIKCEFCNFTSYSKDIILNHVKNQHIKTELCQPLNCKVPQRLRRSNENRVGNNCDLKKRRKRKNHSWTKAKIIKYKVKTPAAVQPAVDSNFYCAHCTYISNRKDNLLTHLQAVHKNLYPKNLFRCKLCHENCHNMYRLQSHYNQKKCYHKNPKVILLKTIKSEH